MKLTGPKQIQSEEIGPINTILKLPKLKDQERILKAAGQKKLVT